VRQLVAVECRHIAPGDVAHLLRRAECLRRGLESENQIVVQMERFVAPRRDAVYIHSHQQWRGLGAQDCAGLFDHLAASRVPDKRIVRLDVAAGKQPALQAAMQHQQDAVLGGAEHQAGAGDVPRIELPPGERLGYRSQQREHELFAFGGFAIVGRVKTAQESGDGFWFYHASIIARVLAVSTPLAHDGRMMLPMNEAGIPDLYQVVLNALDLHASYPIPELRLEKARRRLVVASGNALPTGRIIFADEDAVYCDEGQYTATLDRQSDIDSVVVISASGKKHAPIIVSELIHRSLSPYLITCSPESPAAALLSRERVFVTRSLPEPITYNTSTYLGMVLAKTREDSAQIKQHILSKVAPLIPDFTKYRAFYIMVRPEFELALPMFVTKFDELFGGRLTGRCYTVDQTLHAKTVVPWDKELFISVGTPNEDFGSERFEVPLAEGAGFAAMIATTYYVIGHIQAQNPPWFKEHAEEYTRIQNALFEKLEHQQRKP